MPTSPQVTLTQLNDMLTQCIDKRYRTMIRTNNFEVATFEVSQFIVTSLRKSK